MASKKTLADIGKDVPRPKQPLWKAIQDQKAIRRSRPADADRIVRSPDAAYKTRARTRVGDSYINTRDDLGR